MGGAVQGKKAPFPDSLKSGFISVFMQPLPATSGHQGCEPVSKKEKCMPSGEVRYC